MPVTWEIVKAYFTDMDVQHMKQVSANWPQVMDLHDEASVIHYGTQILDSVRTGRMPIAAPRWTDEMVTNLETFLKEQNPQMTIIK